MNQEKPQRGGTLERQSYNMLFRTILNQQTANIEHDFCSSPSKVNW